MPTCSAQRAEPAPWPPLPRKMRHTFHITIHSKPTPHAGLFWWRTAANRDYNATKRPHSSPELDHSPTQTKPIRTWCMNPPTGVCPRHHATVPRHAIPPHTRPPKPKHRRMEQPHGEQIHALPDEPQEASNSTPSSPLHRRRTTLTDAATKWPSDLTTPSEPNRDIFTGEPRQETRVHPRLVMSKQDSIHPRTCYSPYSSKHQPWSISGSTGARLALYWSHWPPPHRRKNPHGYDATTPKRRVKIDSTPSHPSSHQTLTPHTIGPVTSSTSPS